MNPVTNNIELLDYFAASAMSSYMAYGSLSQQLPLCSLAKLSYELAEAMLAERNLRLNKNTK